MESFHWKSLGGQFTEMPVPLTPLTLLIDISNYGQVSLGGEKGQLVPDRATRSTMSSPCRLNLVRMVWKVLFGAGMSLLDPLRLAPLESFLPKGTSQLGPPAYI